MEINKLYHGDSLELMNDIADGSIDMILCDPPYNTTYAKWDKMLPLDLMWDHYKRIIKDNGAIVFTSSQPFTSMLVMSNPSMFRCEWIWNKSNPTNFANAKKHPLKQHEIILVFSKKQSVYNPQMTIGKPNHKQGNSKTNVSETRLINQRVGDDLSGLKYPKTILDFPKHSSQGGLHPTQKPVSLFEYLIRTYSNEGDVVLDNCIGSGTTAIAAINTERKWIGIEKDEKFFKIAEDRISTHLINNS